MEPNKLNDTSIKPNEGDDNKLNELTQFPVYNKEDNSNNSRGSRGSINDSGILDEMDAIPQVHF